MKLTMPAACFAAFRRAVPASGSSALPAGSGLADMVSPFMITLLSSSSFSPSNTRVFSVSGSSVEASSEALSLEIFSTSLESSSLSSVLTGSVFTASSSMLTRGSSSLWAFRYSSKASSSFSYLMAASSSPISSALLASSFTGSSWSSLISSCWEPESLWYLDLSFMAFSEYLPAPKSRAILSQQATHSLLMPASS